MYENTKQTDFADVMVLSNQSGISMEINNLLLNKELSQSFMSIEQFLLSPPKMKNLGVVIVEATQITGPQVNQLRTIIERVESENIATIIISTDICLPLQNSQLVSIFESGSLEELAGAVEMGIAYRKKLIQQRGKIEQRFGIDSPDKTAAAAEEMANQLQMAGSVQRDFLPNKLPNTENLKWSTLFSPADWVSGDIYDIARLDERHIGFYIADAVGHSMPAALLTIFLKQAIVMRQTIGNQYKIFTPAEVMATLNSRIAAQQFSGCQFVTCCYCLLDTETFLLTYARAGHPYPILIRNNSQPKQLQARGPLLGVFENSEFIQETVQLNSYDKLILYSDGAEPLIGTAIDSENFDYSDEFLRLKDTDAENMIAGLEILAEAERKSPAEIDDITAIALQIS